MTYCFNFLVNFAGVPVTAADRVTLIDVYMKIKEMLRHNTDYEDEESLDFQAYTFIIKQSSFPPNKMMKIFDNLPQMARNNIIKKLDYKNIREFKTNFTKYLAIYRSDMLQAEGTESEFD
jgi:hypothetical protein